MSVRAALRGGAGDVEADLPVCADGSQSETRRRLLPQVTPRYAGYVAWRGTFEEERPPPELVRFFDQLFTFCEARSGGHILCYFIPGPGDTTEPGGRRLNRVWYVNMPDGPELERLLTDRTGKLHVGSVPAGGVPAALTADVRAMGTRELHARFVELVQGISDPFIQIILDVVVPSMAFGRACPLGDAATLRDAAERFSWIAQPQPSVSVFLLQRIGYRGLVSSSIGKSGDVQSR